MTDPAPCATCDGHGEICTTQDYFGEWRTVECRDCHGTGTDQHDDDEGDNE